MEVNIKAYEDLKAKLDPVHVQLVAVSKTKSVEDILALYKLGQRDFGENYVQELIQKQAALPSDIHWHFIGHLQSNKIKQILPIVQLIQGVDSLKLLAEIDKQALKQNICVNCLLQVDIAHEETKFGMNEEEIASAFELTGDLNHVKVKGLMGMGSFTADKIKLRKEFKGLKELYDRFSNQHLLSILSMGMSQDYQLAIEEGSTMVRVGSLLFGERTAIIKN